MQELRGETSRQDAEVRSLREENRGLVQRAALAEALDRDCAALKQKVSAQTEGQRSNRRPRRSTGTAQRSNSAQTEGSNRRPLQRELFDLFTEVMQLV